MRILLYFVFASTLFFSQTIKSQGLLAGEIDWDCIPAGNSNAGKYIFSLKVYQACYNDSSANPLLDSTQILHSNSPAGNRNLHLLDGYPKDLSPVCHSDTSLPHTGCGIADSISAFNGAYRVYVFTDTFALQGTPSAYGWTFFWNGGKRNRSTNLTDSLNPCMRLRSIMYPYGTQNQYPCFDNSPDMAERPVITTCNGYPFMYYPVASDKELDSLYFEWEVLKDSSNSNVSFTTNHTYLNPLPDTSDNPNNVPAALQPFSGELRLTSYSEGGFFANQKISAYKCGIKVAEIYRDMYFQFYNCGTNVSPIMQAPFANGSFVDTILACHRISLNLVFTDSQQLQSHSQNIRMQAFSSQFGNYIPANGSNPPIYDTTAGCLNPPCASLSAAPSDSLPLHDTLLLSTHFSWQTDCGHLATNAGCGATTNIYDFYFKYWDDYCPVPAYNWGHFRIVLNRVKLPPPVFDSLSINPVNGNAHLHWQPIVDSFGLFDYYLIFSSPNKNGPYSILDTIPNTSDSTFLDQNANLSQPRFYFIRTNYDSYFWSEPSDTLHNHINNLKIQKLYNPFVNNNLMLQVKNIGSADIDSIQFSYRQPDSSILIEKWHGKLKAEQSLNFTFSTKVQVTSTAPFQLYARAGLVNDIDTTDNIITESAFVDLKMSELYNPYLFPNLKVRVDVKNLGYFPLDTILFSFKQPDNTVVSELWAGNLLPDSSITYQFQQSYIPSYHPNYYLCAKASVPNDIDITNNRRCRSTPLEIETADNDRFQLMPNIPNPAKESTRIRFRLPKAGEVRLKVYDISGRMLIQENIKAYKGENNYILDVSGFENGVFFYQLDYGEISLRAKFVVLR